MGGVLNKQIRNQQGATPARSPLSDESSQQRHISTAAFALRCGYHQESVRRMIREGRLPAVRFGKRDYRIALAHVEKLESGGRA